MGCAISAKPSSAFQNLLFDYGLRDMGYIGPDFTWSRGAAQVHLDRFICNSYWDEDFPESSVHHLLRLRSDHRPILLHVGPIRHSLNSVQFRYFTGWLSHADFLRMVMDNWQPSVSMSDTLSYFLQAADTWNKTVLAILVRRSGLLWPVSEEELLWRQKSRSEWVLKGDRNTRYFHRRAVNRKQRNKITTLKLLDETWCDDVATLQDEDTRYFASLFSKDIAPHDHFPSEHSFPIIHDNHLCHLDDLPFNDEIHAALSEMAPLKSPGWDEPPDFLLPLLAEDTSVSPC
ncbi:hypothetical protein V6N13_073772 [Hibiscus sabdariffa]